MAKKYIDITEYPCTSFFFSNTEDVGHIFAGITVYKMPVREKGELYDQIADSCDIHFLFDDSEVQIDYYTVPRVDIFATDSCGGQFGTIGECSDIESQAPICYIDCDKKVFLAAGSLSSLLKETNWKEHLIAYDGVEVFSSKDAAEKKYEFLHMPGWYIREISATEVWKLQECIRELSAYHNTVSVHFKGSYPSRPYKETLELFRDALMKKASRIAVVEENSCIAGFCKIDIAKEKGKLDYLVVLEKYRKKHYGKALMDWAMQTFEMEQVGHIEVKVVDGNDALHLYEKYGFKMNAHILVADI